MRGTSTAVAAAAAAAVLWRLWKRRGSGTGVEATRTHCYAAEPLLERRVVVVTGGSSGIGREIALACAKEGADVLVLDTTETPLEGGVSVVNAFSQLKAKILAGDAGSAAARGSVAFMQGDTSAAGVCDRAAQHAVTCWGRLDVWVNNAAIGLGGKLLDTSEDDFDKVLAVDIKGYFFGAKAAVAQFMRQPIDKQSGLRGRLINITSQHGMVACPGDLAYGIGKAASVYMSRQIAVDYAADGIACNGVAPGKIVTGVDSDVRSYSLARTPCPRLGRPSDVASAVVFLASNMASAFITGANIMVDGGWTAF